MPSQRKRFGNYIVGAEHISVRDQAPVMKFTSRSACNVLMIVQNLPVPFDRRVWQEACTLKGMGFGVTVICPKSKAYNKSCERLEGIEIRRYPLLLESDTCRMGYFIEFAYCWFMTLFLALLTFLKRPFQVIHSASPPDTYFAIALIFRAFGVKFVFDHHDLSPELYAAKGHAKKGAIYQALLALERMSFRTADLVITVNQSYREIAKTRGCVPESKIVEVRSGPRRNWAEKRASPRMQKKWRKYLAVFVGQIGKQDGIDYLLHAIRIYCNRYPSDTSFVIIGGGPREQEMRKLAAELRLTDCVCFTGEVSDDDELVSYLSAADLCVDPDPLNEFNDLSTMNKIVEYMALGKPIVAFDLLEHRRTALGGAHYVEPNDVSKFAAAIRELLEDAPGRERMSRLSQERFRHALAWEIFEQKLIRAYTELFLSTTESAISTSASGVGWN